MGWADAPEVEPKKGKWAEAPAIPDGMSPEEYAQSLGFAPTPGGSSVNPEGVADFQNRMTTFAANAAQGMSFGLGDEAYGAIAGIKSMMGGGEYLPAYRAERDDARADMATISERYPNAATGGYLTGAAIPALTASPLATGESMLGTMGRSGLLGMTEGGLQGAGNADGRGIVGETIKGGLIGLGAGIAAPAVIGAATLAKRGLFEGLPQMFGRASQTKANRAIADALMRSGKTAPDVDALIAAATRDGQPEFRLMDALGLPGQRAANGLTRAGGAPGDEVAEFLATRQAGQPERVGAFVEDAFGVKGTTAAKTKEGLDKLATNANNAAYTAARANAGPVNLTPTIETIDDLTNRNPILGESALGDTEIGRRLAKLRGQMTADGEQLIDFNQVLNIKQDLGGIIDGIKVSGKKVPPELAKVYGALDRALEGSSDAYRVANDGARASFKTINAVDEGAAMMTSGRAADNIPQFGAMAAMEQDAARTGYGSAILKVLEDVKTPSTNRALVRSSPKAVAQADAFALDPKLYADRMDREKTMWETQYKALGGSQTANNLEDMNAMTGISGEVMQAGKAAANLQFGDMVQKVAGALGPILKGQNEPTRMLIAQALMSSNAGQVLAPAIAQATKSASVRRILEALLRQPLREGGEALAQ